MTSRKYITAGGADEHGQHQPWWHADGGAEKYRPDNHLSLSLHKRLVEMHGGHLRLALQRAHVALQPLDLPLHGGDLAAHRFNLTGNSRRRIERTVRSTVAGVDVVSHAGYDILQPVNAVHDRNAQHVNSGQDVLNGRFLVSHSRLSYRLGDRGRLLALTTPPGPEHIRASSRKRQQWSHAHER